MLDLFVPDRTAAVSCGAFVRRPRCWSIFCRSVGCRQSVALAAAWLACCGCIIGALVVAASWLVAVLCHVIYYAGVQLYLESGTEYVSLYAARHALSLLIVHHRLSVTYVQHSLTT